MIFFAYLSFFFCVCGVLMFFILDEKKIIQANPNKKFTPKDLKMIRNSFILSAPIFFVLGSGLWYWSGQTKTEDKKEITQENKTIEKKQEIIPFKKHKTLREKLLFDNDYREEGKTLKFISEDIKSLHVQISEPLQEDDTNELKTQTSKRDIVYVALGTFAQTDIDEFTITAVPVEATQRTKYFDAQKITAKVTRQKAKSILQEYLNTQNFEVLYSLNGNIWVPSKDFEILKGEKLNEVFEKLTK